MKRSRQQLCIFFVGGDTDEAEAKDRVASVGPDRQI